MKTEEEIREKYVEVEEAARQAKTSDDKLYFYGRLALLGWALED